MIKMYAAPEQGRIEALLLPGYLPPSRDVQATLERTYYPAGNGYLGGSFPSGITTLDGAPVAATVRVLLRAPGFAFDGVLIAQTTSAVDGTWRVDGLNPALRYDVVGRKDGYNDVIVSGVSPEPY